MLIVRTDLDKNLEQDEKGRFICPWCDGDGVVEKEYHFPHTVERSVCDACGGDGILTPDGYKKLVELENTLRRWFGIKNE